MTIRLLAVAHMCLFALILPASAHDVRVGDMVVSQAWARATPGIARTGAAYLTIANHGATADKLVAVSTPVARKAELHTNLMQNNIMKMRRLAAIEVNPGTPSVLRPGGMHVMLMGLAAPLKEGDVFRLVLTFEKAGAVEVRVEVQKIGAMQPGGNGSGHHMGHKGGS